ncbi:MAG: indolepyruvate oxidoreductase subunit beta [Fimbriimonadaceae bacterium]|nr:indolepyruvate oxidoreductase subunit beta [Fimbriimonadaceae bacterium]
MRYDIVLAGVGGQGILTIARIVSGAAIANGWNVKQAEVHGMSQRGGAVNSHLRLSDEEIHSDLIPKGQADLILAVEPLEALRYEPMLREEGAIVASTNAVANIQSYPAIERVLERLCRRTNHVCLDMENLGRAAGNPLASNMVALGAAAGYLPVPADDLEREIADCFAAKGERVVEANVRGFRFGRAAASAYAEAMLRGIPPSAARGWIETLSPAHLESDEPLDLAGVSSAPEARLSGAEAHAFESVLLDAYHEGRRQLYEHEVYRLIELVGAISPPRHVFVPKGSAVSAESLAGFPGERVVCKLVSPNVVHKSDAGAVVFVSKSLEQVNLEIDRLVSRHADDVQVAGVLVVEFVEHAFQGLGSELFVGIRSTREFGPVVAAGLGGLDTEYLSSKLARDVAVAKAPAMDLDAERFLAMFRQTVAYDVLSGKARGHRRRVSDAELLRCFRAFISIAKWFCVDRGEEGPDIGELEVNPFAFRNDRMVPLDGRGCLRTAARAEPPRPRRQVRCLLAPETLAMVGVSSDPNGFGRLVLRNTLKAGYPVESLTIVKDGLTEIDGVRCVPRVSDLPAGTDLLVIAAPASAVPQIVAEANDKGTVRACIVISGGAGETAGSVPVGEAIREAVRAGREGGEGLVLLGPNCLGVRSAWGRYDTFFIPDDKMPVEPGAPHPVALVSQSGAFVVSRLSGLRHLRPLASFTIGNQADVTVSDLLWTLAERDDLRAVGVYLEGFANWDGLETLRAIARLTETGRTVAFYKGGRSESGRSAASGHTAAIAGDYDVCRTALTEAGALVAEETREFGQLLELATFLGDRRVDGTDLFGLTNAGFEAVAMADAEPSFRALGAELEETLRTVLDAHRLGGLVAPRNPLDVTPMADERAYEALLRAALARPEVHGAIVSCVPLAPRLSTLAEELSDEGSFARFAREWRNETAKPVVFVVDSGSRFDALREAVRTAGVPVFDSADEAARRFGRYLRHRSSTKVRAD